MSKNFKLKFNLEIEKINTRYQASVVLFRSVYAAYNVFGMAVYKNKKKYGLKFGIKMKKHQKKLTWLMAKDNLSYKKTYSIEFQKQIQGEKKV